MNFNFTFNFKDCIKVFRKKSKKKQRGEIENSISLNTFLHNIKNVSDDAKIKIILQKITNHKFSCVLLFKNITENNILKSELIYQYGHYEFSDQISFNNVISVPLNGGDYMLNLLIKTDEIYFDTSYIYLLKDIL